jgi:hypothetical protein
MKFFLKAQDLMPENEKLNKKIASVAVRRHYISYLL